MLFSQHFPTLAAGLLATAAFSQTFDVASLTTVPYVPGSYHADLGTVHNGQLTFTNATLCEMLRYAYDINNDDQIAGPDWIKSRAIRFDITAKAPPATPLPNLRRMLQTLLQQRFQMTLHTEDRVFTHLALVPSKKGPKIQLADSATPAPGMEINGTIRSSRMTMSQLAALLARFLRQPVRDLTQLDGLYAIDLHWTPENQLDNPGADLAASPSIYTAVQEQLGLTLEPRKGPLPVIVVDRATRDPVPN